MRRALTAAASVALSLALPAVACATPFSGSHPPFKALASGCPTAPSPMTYAYIETYVPACSTTTNHGRTFPDVTISNSAVSVTAATVLAGAIPSVKLGGTELVAAGGHGESWGWNFHSWASTTARTQAEGLGPSATTPSECYNATQEGAVVDDLNQTAPYRASSSSYLRQEQAVSSSEIDTAGQMALFVGPSDPNAGYGGCTAAQYQLPGRGDLSPYSLSNEYTLNGHTIHLQGQVAGTLATPVTDGWDSNLVLYLQSNVVDAYTYDPTMGTLTAIPGNKGASASPTIRCDAAGTLCVGLYFKPSLMPSSYYYVDTEPPSSYSPNGVFSTQITEQVANPNLDASVVVGNLPTVEAGLNALAATP